jgi:hypothetical protein
MVEKERAAGNHAAADRLQTALDPAGHCAMLSPRGQLAAAHLHAVCK